MNILYIIILLIIAYGMLSNWFFFEYKKSVTLTNLNQIKLDKFILYQFCYISKGLKKCFILNEGNLAKQPIFWIGICFPLVVAFWLEYNIIMINKITLSIDDIDYLFNKSSVSIYLFALSPTLGIIISNIHRTIQTEKQLISLEMKNNMDIFYAHNKYIIDEFKSLDSDKNRVVIINPNLLYKKIFSGSSYLNGVACISQCFLMGVIESLKVINDSIKKNNFNRWDSFSNDNYLNEEDSIKNLMDMDREILFIFDLNVKKIISMFEVEFVSDYEVYKCYSTNYRNKFKNPYFDDEYEQAESEGNWTMLQNPELYSFHYTIENILNFLELLIQTIEMIIFLIERMLNVLEINNDSINFLINDLKESTSVLGVIKNNYSLMYKSICVSMIEL